VNERLATRSRNRRISAYDEGNRIPHKRRHVV
jgi:hypothetical protein